MSSERLPDDTGVDAAMAAPEPEPEQAPEATVAAEAALETEPVAEVAAAAEVVTAPGPAPVAPAAPAGPRFARMRATVRRLRPIVQVGLFVIGIAIGYAVFQATKPIVAGQPAVIQDGTATTVTPPAVRDLVAALQSDDQNAVRAVLDSAPYRLLAGELSSMRFQSINGVDTLSTYTYDNLAATEIVIRGLDGDGNATAINLVVHEKDNVIVSFR